MNEDNFGPEIFFHGGRKTIRSSVVETANLYILIVIVTSRGLLK